tara:strand:- start:84 stop:335 length:252 start_codon:yes stop_codon:yes gene_type:complete
MRTNLLQRLKPEFKKGFDNNREKYAFMVNDIEKTLNSKEFYNSLSIDLIKSIWLFGDVPGGYDRSSFDWSYGQDTFEKENDVC